MHQTAIYICQSYQLPLMLHLSQMLEHKLWPLVVQTDMGYGNVAAILTRPAAMQVQCLSRFTPSEPIGHTEFSPYMVCREKGCPHCLQTQLGTNCRCLHFIVDARTRARAARCEGIPCITACGDGFQREGCPHCAQSITRQSGNGTRETGGVLLWPTTCVGQIFMQCLHQCV